MLGYSVPFLFHPDEYAISNAAYENIKYTRLDSNFYLYPPLSQYFYTAADYIYLKLSRESSIENKEPLFFYRYNRAISIIFSLLSVFFVFLITSRIFGNRAGAAGSLFMAFSYSHIQQSWVIKPDSGMLCFFLVTVYFLIRFLSSLSGRDIMAAYLFAACAVFFKYNALLILLPLLAVSAYSWKTSAKSIIKAFLAAVLFSLLIFLPFAGNIIKAFAVPFAALKGYQSPENSSLINFYFFNYLFTKGMGILPFSLSAAALIYFSIKREPTPSILVFMIWPYLLMLLFVKNDYDQHALIIVPLLYVLTAGFIYRIFEKKVFLLAAVSIPVALSNYYNVNAFIEAHREPDPRVLARHWILSGLDPDKSVIYGLWGPPMSDFDPAVNGCWSLVPDYPEVTYVHGKLTKEKTAGYDYVVVSGRNEVYGKEVKKFAPVKGISPGITVYKNTFHIPRLRILTRLPLTSQNNWKYHRASRDIMPLLEIKNGAAELSFTDTKRNDGFHHLVQQSDLTAFFSADFSLPRRGYIVIRASWPSDTRFSVYGAGSNGTYPLIEGKKGLKQEKTLYLPAPADNYSGLLIAFSTPHNRPHTDMVKKLRISSITVSVPAK